MSGGRPAHLPVYVYAVLAGFAFNIFSGNSQALGLPVSLDRPFFLLALLLILTDTEAPKLRVRAVWPVSAALVLFAFGSWMFTGDLSDSLKAFALLDRVAMPVVMLALGALAFTDTRARLALLKFLAVAGLYVSTVGILAFARIDALVFPRYIADIEIGLQSDRARGPFLASEPYGMVCAVVAFAAICLMAQPVSRRWRVFAALSLVVASSGVVLCLTRSVWLGAILGAVVAGVLTARTRRVLLLATPVIAVITAAGLAVFPSVLTLAQTRLNTASSIYDRLNTNDAALRVVETRPFLGIGWGNFQSQSWRWVRQADLVPLNNTDIEVHNVFLSRAVELGLIGAALWLVVVLVGPVTAVVRAPASSKEIVDFKLLALASGMVWLVPSLSSPNPYPMANWLIWCLAGVAGSAWLAQGTTRAAAVEPPVPATGSRPPSATAVPGSGPR